jgi:hypothetical protein
VIFRSIAVPIRHESARPATLGARCFYGEIAWSLAGAVKILDVMAVLGEPVFVGRWDRRAGHELWQRQAGRHKRLAGQRAVALQGQVWYLTARPAGFDDDPSPAPVRAPIASSDP